MKTLTNILLLLLFSTSSFAQLEWESKASIPDYGLSQGVGFGVGGKAFFGLETGMSFVKFFLKLIHSLFKGQLLQSG